MLPSQQQLLIPLLETMRELGGNVSTRELCTQLAEKVEISQEERTRTTDMPSAKAINVWDRQVRWTQQLAKFHQYVAHRDTYWTLTEAGDSTLQNARPGVIVTIFEAENGVALWAEAEATVNIIEDDTVAAIITSPPYPLLRKKDYANQLDEAEHVTWLANFFGQAKQKLCHDGSLVLNLGPVWQPGQPSTSLYAERLLIKLCDEIGYHLAQKFYWHNPSKMPSPAEWVTVRRIRVTPAVEEVYWLSKNLHSQRGGPHVPKADNNKVLRPYSQSMLDRIAAGGEKGKGRPSGHQLKQGAFNTDNGGSIPHNIIVAANTSSNDAYQRYCRKNNLTAHPARFPSELPEFFIQMLTEPGEIIWDPFGGSLQTSESARKLDRRFITNEKSLAFLDGGIGGRLATF
jgi:site-specific DNA-methyltransferase (cytosine-N4-specific)